MLYSCDRATNVVRATVGYMVLVAGSIPAIPSTAILQLITNVKGTKRMAKRTIEVTGSSAISAIGYDEDKHILYWTMKRNGEEIPYEHVNPAALSEVLSMVAVLGWGRTYNEFKRVYALFQAMKQAASGPGTN